MRRLAPIEALLRDRLAGTLPGVDAQLRFAPSPPRAGWKAGEFPPDARAAAGLLLLYPSEDGVARAADGPRARRSRATPARSACRAAPPIPGETLVEAALREAYEEIGVDPSAVRILGELTPVHVHRQRLHAASDRRRHRDAPALPARPPAKWTRSSRWRSTTFATRRASARARGIREGVAVEYPYFDLLGHQVWGATAMVLGEFICLLEE